MSLRVAHKLVAGELAAVVARDPSAAGAQPITRLCRCRSAGAGSGELHGTGNCKCRCAVPMHCKVQGAQGGQDLSKSSNRSQRRRRQAPGIPRFTCGFRVRHCCQALLPGTRHARVLAVGRTEARISLCKLQVAQRLQSRLKKGGAGRQRAQTLWERPWRRCCVCGHCGFCRM